MRLKILLALMAAAGTTPGHADEGELPEGFSGATLMYYRALYPACPAPNFEEDYLIQGLRQSNHELDDWVAGTAMADELASAREQAAEEHAKAKEACVERDDSANARAYAADLLQLDQALGLLDRIIVDANDNTRNQREED